MFFSAFDYKLNRLFTALRLFLFLLPVAIIQGCVIHATPLPDDPSYAPVMPPAPSVTPETNGSLYRPGAELNLFSDNIAHRIGDIVTVMLEENTRSTKSSSMDITKEADLSVPGAGLLLGNAVDIETSLSNETEFSGAGDASQSNNLSGSIAVSVVDIWPNGTLVIRGEKWLTLNRGQEFIRINGLVRPNDISPDNTVLSTRVANARITYSGTGQMADSQSMGWLSRFFTSAYWPL